ETLLRNETDHLADYNLGAVRALSTELGIQTPIVLGTSLGVDGRATDLLIRMVEAVGGSAYLAGGGSAGDQEDDKFREAGIQVTYQEFQDPTYPQFNTNAFKAGLSIVDALMNCGFDGTYRLLAARP